ncbi:MAG: ribbon-helix-helix protein, CopG family [Bryobacterales bacterium]
MTVQLPPELEKQLDEAARQARISKDDLVRDVLRGYLQEAADVRAMLARRYDDLESGRVKAIPTEEAIACGQEEAPAGNNALALPRSLSDIKRSGP